MLISHKLYESIPNLHPPYAQPHVVDVSIGEGYVDFHSETTTMMICVNILRILISIEAFDRYRI